VRAAIANFKGGLANRPSRYIFAHAAALAAYRVLAVIFDPPSHA